VKPIPGMIAFCERQKSGFARSRAWRPSGGVPTQSSSSGTRAAMAGGYPGVQALTRLAAGLGLARRGSEEGTATKREGSEHR